MGDEEHFSVQELVVAGSPLMVPTGHRFVSGWSSLRPGETVRLLARLVGMRVIFVLLGPLSIFWWRRGVSGPARKGEHSCWPFSVSGAFNQFPILGVLEVYVVLSEGLFDLQEEQAYLHCLPLLVWGQKVFSLHHPLLLGGRM